MFLSFEVMLRRLLEMSPATARRMRGSGAACPVSIAVRPVAIAARSSIGIRRAVGRAVAIVACVAALCPSWMLVASVARGATAAGAASYTGATPYIDGISDQNLPEWDGAFAGSYFGDLFEREWVRDGHIRLARYVVQWDVMSAGPAGSRLKFENWLRDVKELGLTADVALTSYDGSYPSSAGDYGSRLAEVLRRAAALGEPARYLEAWNEPNNQGRESPTVAAAFADVAQAACASQGCSVVAGDLEDAPGAGRYEEEYARDLHRAPSIWGVHPYRSVQEMSMAPLRELVRDLPSGDATELWFTEVAARACTDYGGELRINGETGQTARVRWLLDTLMPYARPAHVFYYTFLLADRRGPSCTRGEPEDDALYVPGVDAGAPDVARRAAAYVLEGGRAARVFTGVMHWGTLVEAFAAPLGGSAAAAEAISW